MLFLHSILSFAVKKLLNFLRSHLSTVGLISWETGAYSGRCRWWWNTQRWRITAQRDQWEVDIACHSRSVSAAGWGGKRALIDFIVNHLTKGNVGWTKILGKQCKVCAKTPWGSTSNLKIRAPGFKVNSIRQPSPTGSTETKSPLIILNKLSGHIFHICIYTFVYMYT